MKLQLTEVVLFAASNSALMLTRFVTLPKSHLHADYVFQPGETQLAAKHGSTLNKATWMHAYPPVFQSTLHVSLSALWN
jgi:hypothetical protein